MKKTYLNLLVASLLLGGFSTGVVSCSSDYDGDISELKTGQAAHAKQLETLQSALTAAQEAAKAAQSAADNALKAGEQAVAEAELAKKAAADAKAAAIAEVMAQVKPILEAYEKSIGDNAKDVAALSGRIEGIEKGLSAIDLGPINKQLGDQAQAIADQAKTMEAVQIQIKALEEFKAAITSKLSNYDGLVQKMAAIDGILKDLKSVQDEVKQIGLDLKDVNASIGTINGTLKTVQDDIRNLAGDVSKQIGTAVNTLVGTLTRRLSSVTLIPSEYIDGIPAITFESAKYTKKEFKNNAWIDATSGKTSYIVSNNTATAEYRLNPGTLTDDDINIGKLAYVGRVAISRANSEENCVVNVASASVGANGILTVKLGKNTTESLNLSGNKINTVALRVPVAAKHLLKDEGEANVYSEYSRLDETYFRPELRFIEGSYLGAASHLNDSTSLYASGAGAMISKNYVYNKSHNLYDLVEGCKFFSTDNHSAMTRADLQSYGMDIKFHVATRAYTPSTPDATNQQKFVKLSGENNSVLTPISSSGLEGNQVTIGKQPIIAATLVDVTNNNVIEQKYFKINFTAEDMQDVAMPLNINVKADACTGVTHNFTWQYMAENVLEKLNGGNGMSKEDFNKIYTSNTVTSSENKGTVVVNVIGGSFDVSTPVMTWTFNAGELGKLKVGDNTMTNTQTVTFTDPTGLHPNVILKITFNISTNVAATVLGVTDPLKWNNGTIKIYPVPMMVPYDGTQKATYKTNILEGRVKPYFKGALPCAKIDVDYADADNSAYIGNALNFPSGFGHWMITAANATNLDAIYYEIANTAEGRKLVSSAATVKVDWSSDINGNTDNRYVFGSMNLKIVKILTINTTISKALVDDSHSQTIDLLNSYSLTDAYGHKVAAVADQQEPYAADYYKFYGVQTAKFGNDIKLADNAEGTVGVRSLASLNMTANVDASTGELTFQNNGAPLQGNAYLIVPVTVSHLWGTLNGTVAVPLKKSDAPLNARRR